MSSINCNYECNQSRCPFRTDPFDSSREVCLKCGKEYSFRRGRFSIFLMIWVIAAILLLMNNPDPETESQPETQLPSQALKSKS